MACGLAPFSWEGQAGEDLLPGCAGYLLYPNPLGRTGTAGAGGPDLQVAFRGSEALNPWDGDLIVARVHIHDPEAAQCDASDRDACEAAIIVEQVVWPTVPSEIDGQHVYRASESAKYDKLSGSFLLGGYVAEATPDPGCEPPAQPTAERLLAPDCPQPSIDGEPIAPASKVDPAPNQIAVVRAHVNDARAAGCSTDFRSECEQAIVIDAAVWSYGPYAPPYVIVTSTPAPVGPSAGPLAPDGVPMAFGGQPVYRGSNLPSDSSFLLGGRLTQVGSCPSGQPARLLAPRRPRPAATGRSAVWRSGRLSTSRRTWLAGSSWWRSCDRRSSIAPRRRRRAAHSQSWS